MKLNQLVIIIVLFVSVNFLQGCGDSSELLPPSSLSANAGIDINVKTGAQVVLNGNGSSDKDGGNFGFSWKFIAKPSDSNTSLDKVEEATPEFIPDIAGKYKVELTISNGQSNSLDTITVAAFSVINLAGSYNNMMPGPNVGIRKFEVFKNQLYATCEFTEIGGYEIKKIACYDGASWFALGCGLEDGTIFDMEVFNNELYVTGRFDEIGCIEAKNIARWDCFGWNAVGSGIGDASDAAGFALEVYQGELYVGGRFTRAGNVAVSNMAKWDGNQWSAVGALEGGSVRSLQVYDDRLYAGGFFDQVTGTDAEYLACYNGSQWSSLGSTSNLELGATGVIRQMAVFQDQLFLSGDFELNNKEFSELITWDGNQLNDFGRAFSLLGSNEIKSLSVFDEALYIGGEFDQVVGTQANSILKWDGAQWAVMAAGIDGTVLTIQPFGGQLYVGGDFTAAGNQVAENISIWSE